jgi:hypothetical protein
MDDRLDIPIVTTSDTSGAKQTAKALDEVTKASTAQASAQSKLGQSTEDLSKKVGFLNLSKGELKKSVKELTRSFPELSLAIRAAMNPVVASISVAISVFVKAKQALAAWNEEMDQASERAAKKEFEAGINAKAASLHQAAIKSTEFKESLSAMADGQDDFTKKTQAAIDKLHEFISAQSELNSAAEAKEQADVNTAQKLGKLSERDAISKRAEIKTRYRAADAELKTQAEENELRLKASQLDHAKTQAPELEKDATKKRAEAERLRARLASSEQSIPGATETLKQYTDEYLKKSDQAAKQEKIVGSLSNPLVGGVLPEEAKAHARERLETLRKEKADAAALMDRQKALLDSYQRDKKEIGEQLLPKAEIGAKTAEAKLTGNITSQLSLEKEVDSLTQTLPVRRATRQKVLGIKNKTDSSEALGALASTPEGQSLARVAADADTISATHGKGAAAAEARDRSGALISQLGQALAGNKASFDQCVAIVSKFNDSQAQFKTELDRQSQRIDALSRSTLNQIRR